jgi:hypothetical protein
MVSGGSAWGIASANNRLSQGRIAVVVELSTSDLDQLEVERLDLSQDAMERRLVRQPPRKDRVPSIGARTQARERAAERRPQHAADAYLVVLGNFHALGHDVSIGLNRLTPHRPDRMIELREPTVAGLRPSPATSRRNRLPTAPALIGGASSLPAALRAAPRLSGAGKRLAQPSRAPVVARDLMTSGLFGRETMGA